MICPICKKDGSPQVVPIELIHEPFLSWIQHKHPSLGATEPVCLECLNSLRSEYIQDILSLETNDMAHLSKDVIASLRKFNPAVQNSYMKFDQTLTMGQRVADRVATFGGSWTFIIFFFAVLVTWMTVNTSTILSTHFDPYPYILLNLVLSCLAAIQAPIIMMSQNRVEQRDRLHAENDYRINLKAELEIRHLNMKMDRLLSHQWQRLLEIQRVQVELMEELTRKKIA